MIVRDADQMKSFGLTLGKLLQGGECFELVGDIGAGKTTLVKGIAEGLLVDEDVQSPTFTISRVYEARDGLSLEHYDFYRLNEPGVMSYELAESLENPQAITILEWAQTVQNVLPHEVIKITILYQPDSEARRLDVSIPDRYQYLGEAL